MFDLCRYSASHFLRSWRSGAHRGGTRVSSSPTSTRCASPAPAQHTSSTSSGRCGGRSSSCSPPSSPCSCPSSTTLSASSAPWDSGPSPSTSPSRCTLPRRRYAPGPADGSASGFSASPACSSPWLPPAAPSLASYST